MTRKPIVSARERSPFGDIDAEAARKGAAQGRDLYYLPGYSDKRVQRDLDERAGKPTTPLTHRFEVVGTQTLGGKPTTRATSDFKIQGYRPVKGTDVKALGLSLEGSNYTVGEDGNVYLQEGLLMVCDAETARRNVASKQHRDAMAEEAPRAAMQAAVDRFNQTNGLEPDRGASLVDADDVKLSGTSAKR